jgi:hypothetical protein
VRVAVDAHLDPPEPGGKHPAQVLTNRRGLLLADLGEHDYPDRRCRGHRRANQVVVEGMELFRG